MCTMKTILPLVFALILIGTAWAGEFSPALQMDTYTDTGNKEQSFGPEDTLWVSSQNGQPEKIAYLAFAGMTKLPQQISSGSLKMYAKEVERPGKVSIHLYNQAAMDIIS